MGGREDEKEKRDRKENWKIFSSNTYFSAVVALNELLSFSRAHLYD